MKPGSNLEPRPGPVVPGCGSGIHKQELRPDRKIARYRELDPSSQADSQFGCMVLIQIGNCDQLARGRVLTKNTLAATEAVIRSDHSESPQDIGLDSPATIEMVDRIAGNQEGLEGAESKSPWLLIPIE